MKTNEFSKEVVRYVFTKAEKKEMSVKLAQQIVNLQQAEVGKKAVMSDYKSRIGGIRAQVNSLAANLNAGYEMRRVECEIVPD